MSRTSPELSPFRRAKHPTCQLVALVSQVGASQARISESASSSGVNAGDELLYAEDWNFETQPVTSMTYTVHKSDNIFLRCTHANSGDTAVPYGESSDTEMCAFVMFYAPAAGLDGCIKQ